MYSIGEIRKLNIRQRMILFCVALGSGVTLLTWSLVSNMTEISTLSNEIEARWLPRERLLGQVKTLVANYRYWESVYLLSRSSGERAGASKELNSTRAEIDEKLDSYLMHLNDRDTELLDRAKQIRELWGRYARQGVPSHKDGTPVFSTLRERLEELDELEQAKTIAAIHADDQIYDKSYVLLLLSSGVFLFIILILFFYVDMKVIDPLLTLSRTVSVLSSGDLAAPLGGHERHDEIGLMTRSVEQFRALATNLDRSEKQMARLIEASFDGTLIFRDGKVLHANEVFRRRFGTGTETNVESWMSFPRDTDLAKIERDLNNGTTSKRIFRDVQLAPRDGARLLVDLSLSRIDWGGEPAVLLVAHDVSDRASLASAISGAATAEFQRLQAEEANLAKSLFISSISHELRNPLNTIIGFSQVMETEVGASNPGWARYAVNIRKSGQHLLALIEDLLDLSVLEAGKLSFFMKSYPARDFLREVLTAWKPMAMESGLDWRESIDLPVDVNVSIDKTRMRQVIANLISNAIKYNRKGGSIWIKVGASGDNIRIEVEDTGKGISAANSKHVFEPFNRLGAEKSEIKGMGIGLALSRRLCTNMGAAIDFISEEGKGTRFWVDIPVIRGEAFEAHREQVSLVAHDEPAANSAKTVLYVEDSETNYEVIAAMLKDLPVDLLWVTTAEEGLGLVQKRRPSLILMDINLPGMDGFSALRKLRAHKSTADIPVVAISANAEAEVVKRAKREGFEDYITKPVDIRRVIEVVHTFA